MGERMSKIFENIYEEYFKYQNEFIFTKSENKNFLQQLIPFEIEFIFINSSQIQILTKIGEGNFGCVYRGLYKDTHEIAIKILKSQQDYSFEQINNENLLNEASIMSRLKHENILNIFGITFIGKDNQLCLITEFMSNGSLLDYLRKSRKNFNQFNSKDIQKIFYSFSKQIFEAMIYLEKQNIIHRDLAARNCLIHQNYSIKIADFGLTKLTECGLYKGNSRKICAIRWTSPEALFFSKYSSRSDVWSYGITLWEIFSLGQRPFTYLNNQQVKSILEDSSQNLTQYLPQSTYSFANQFIYTHLILPCLTRNVNVRPKFADLNQRISFLFQ